MFIRLRDHRTLLKRKKGSDDPQRFSRKLVYQMEDDVCGTDVKTLRVRTDRLS